MYYVRSGVLSSLYHSKEDCPLLRRPSTKSIEAIDDSVKDQVLYSMNKQNILRQPCRLCAK